MNTQKIIINAPKDIHRRLKTMAFMKETTMTEIILKEIKKVLKEYEENNNK